MMTMRHRNTHRPFLSVHFGQRLFAALAAGLLVVACAQAEETVNSRWAETLREFDATLQARSRYNSPLRRGAAQEYLAKNIALELHQNIIRFDPVNPRLVNHPGFGFPNVDTFYLTSHHLDPAGVYRLYGRLGSVNQTIFGVYAGNSSTNVTGAGARVHGIELENVDDDGNFEIFLSAEPRGENWLQMRPQDEILAVYQIFGDWEREQKGAILIERLDTAGETTSLPTEDVLARRYSNFEQSLRTMISYWAQQGEARLKLPPNQFGAPSIIQVASRGRSSPTCTGSWRTTRR